MLQCKGVTIMIYDIGVMIVQAAAGPSTDVMVLGFNGVVL
jgi:hypothetical protein